MDYEIGREIDILEPSPNHHKFTLAFSARIQIKFDGGSYDLFVDSLPSSDNEEVLKEEG